MLHLIRLLSCLIPLLAVCAAEHPNVLVILADDLGYGDVQCYNPQRGKIATPHMDRLAAEGIRFTDGHSSSGVCSPSRYTLLTGRYHWRSRLQAGIVGLWERPLIEPERLTIARLVQSQGYRTGCIGKWHLGWNWPATQTQRQHLTRFAGKRAAGAAPLSVTDEDRAAWKAIFSQPLGGGPLALGFERYFGTDVPNWPPYCFIDQDRTVGIPEVLLPDNLLKNNHASNQGPALADWALEPILPTLVERAQRFITDAAAARQPFLLYLPLTTPHTPLAVNAAWRGRSGLDSLVADLVMETDDAIGRILSTLSTLGLERDTLVLVTSDNGMAPYTGAAALEAKGHFPSGPLKGYKGDTWEGGHRVPFIVRWPAVSPAGRVCDHLVHHADLMATLAEIVGTSLPASAGEDSISLLPLLRGEDRPVREHAISAGAHGVPALRVGSWKLISGRPGGGFAKDRGADAVSLYDLANDLAEAVDRSVDEPARVRDMKELLERLIVAGRSTPGAPSRNDVEVRRHPAE